MAVGPAPKQSFSYEGCEASATGLPSGVGGALISGRSSGSRTFRSCTARPLVKEKRAASGPGT